MSAAAQHVEVLEHGLCAVVTHNIDTFYPPGSRLPYSELWAAWADSPIHTALVSAITTQGFVWPAGHFSVLFPTLEEFLRWDVDKGVFVSEPLSAAPLTPTQFRQMLVGKVEGRDWEGDPLVASVFGPMIAAARKLAESVVVPDGIPLATHLIDFGVSLFGLRNAPPPVLAPYTSALFPEVGLSITATIPPLADTLFALADANKDGKLTPAEYRVLSVLFEAPEAGADIAGSVRQCFLRVCALLDKGAHGAGAVEELVPEELTTGIPILLLAVRQYADVLLRVFADVLGPDAVFTFVTKALEVADGDSDGTLTVEEFGKLYAVMVGA